MSTADPEEVMRRMIEELDLPLPDPETNVQTIADFELLRRFNDVTQELLAMGEALSPKSQKARDLHSTRAAYLVELKRRRLR